LNVIPRIEVSEKYTKNSDAILNMTSVTDIVWAIVTSDDRSLLNYSGIVGYYFVVYFVSFIFFETLMFLL
jgi:hypothetical protein